MNRRAFNFIVLAGISVVFATGAFSGESKTPEAAAENKKPAAVEEKKPAAAVENKTPVVVIETSLGTIEAELYADKAPETVKNFLTYAKDKFYDGTVFHRVIENFMIQGGGMEGPDLKQKQTRASIQNEADNGLRNEIGTLAMARTGDPHSATAQFFINVANNDFLNHTAKTPRGWGYAVFGKVTSGMDVVMKIKAVKTQKADVPVEEVTIKSVREKQVVDKK